MTPADIVALFGRPSSDPALAQLWNSFGLRWRPALDPERPELFTDWFPIREAGIEFGFEDEAYLRAEPPQLRGRLPMLFHEVIFYGEHPKMQTYRGDLPFGLVFAADRSAVVTRLRSLQVPCRSHVRDVWELPEFRLIVSYRADDSRIVDVICCLREAAWPLEEPLPPHPSAATVARLLGKSVRSPEFGRAFFPLGVAYELERLQSDAEINKRDEFGFDIHVGEVSSGVRPDGRFDSITFYRARDLDARQWAGELPFGLQFSDSPPQLLAKVPFAPVEKHEERLSGTALWHLEACSLHVQYSTLDNLLYRVTLFRRGLLN